MGQKGNAFFSFKVKYFSSATVQHRDERETCSQEKEELRPRSAATERTRNLIRTPLKMMMSLDRRQPVSEDAGIGYRNNKSLPKTKTSN